MHAAVLHDHRRDPRARRSLDAHRVVRVLSERAQTHDRFRVRHPEPDPRIDLGGNERRLVDAHRAHDDAPADLANADARRAHDVDAGEIERAVAAVIDRPVDHRPRAAGLDRHVGDRRRDRLAVLAAVHREVQDARVALRDRGEHGGEGSERTRRRTIGVRRAGRGDDERLASLCALDRRFGLRAERDGRLRVRTPISSALRSWTEHARIQSRRDGERFSAHRNPPLEPAVRTAA